MMPFQGARANRTGLPDGRPGSRTPTHAMFSNPRRLALSRVSPSALARNPSFRVLYLNRAPPRCVLKGCGGGPQPTMSGPVLRDSQHGYGQSTRVGERVLLSERPNKCSRCYSIYRAFRKMRTAKVAARYYSRSEASSAMPNTMMNTASTMARPRMP